MAIRTHDTRVRGVHTRKQGPLYFHHATHRLELQRNCSHRNIEYARERCTPGPKALQRSIWSSAVPRKPARHKDRDSQREQLRTRKLYLIYTLTSPKIRGVSPSEPPIPHTKKRAGERYTGSSTTFGRGKTRRAREARVYSVTRVIRQAAASSLPPPSFPPSSPRFFRLDPSRREGRD